MIGEVHRPLGQKRFDILPHTLRLAYDVAHVHHSTFVVNRSGAADVGVGTVAKLEESAALKGNAIFDGGIKIRQGIKVALLLRLKSGEGIGAELDEGVRIGPQPTNTSGGDVVGVLGESLLLKIFKACPHHTGILRIDIAHNKTSAHTMIGQGRPKMGEGALVVRKNGSCLLCRIATTVAKAHLSKMPIAVVFHHRWVLLFYLESTCSNGSPLLQTSFSLFST